MKNFLNVNYVILVTNKKKHQLLAKAAYVNSIITRDVKPVVITRVVITRDVKPVLSEPVKPVSTQTGSNRFKNRQNRFFVYIGSSQRIKH